MLLTIDIGNTNITLGTFSGDDLIFTARAATNRSLTSDEYAVTLSSLICIKGCSLTDIHRVIISSVVPPLTMTISRAIESLTGAQPLIVGPGVKTGLNILIDDPGQTGADLVAVSVAAKALYPCPNVVCDLGTASTITVLDQNGNMIGGAIYPGISTSLEALVSNTSLLQHISIEAPSRVIGKSTSECMQSGMVFGAAALLDGMLDRMENELALPVTAIATGGFGKAVIPYCKRHFEYNENLILLGLKMISDKNR